MAKDEHNPRYQYDCENCKFHWCCDETCSCGLRRKGFPNPPEKRKHEVDAALVKIGFAPQFYGSGAQRR